jgi:endonuclease/exonuclease/phosphatase family metal-dependent hydrolase
VSPFQRRIGGRIALISSIDFPGQRLIVYNVHLESRGDDGLRCSQLAEILADVSQHASGVQVVIAGDFNANLRQEPAVSAIRNAKLSNLFTHVSSLPITVVSRFNEPRAIDWILTKGPMIASELKVHDAIRASDHYPISFVLSGRPHDTQRGRKHE